MALSVSFLRVCPNGRWELLCRRCARFLWLTPHELMTWQHCPHCLGWWQWNGQPNE